MVSTKKHITDELNKVEVEKQTDEIIDEQYDKPEKWLTAFVCISFFPVTYFIGKTLMNFFN